MTRIPREYTPQDHLTSADHFNFNVSTDLQEVAARREQRGKGANIIGDQSAGIEIGRRTLAQLEDSELQTMWAHVFGGALLNSSLYMFRKAGDQPMFRRFTLPRIVTDEGVLQDGEAIDATTLRVLEDVQVESEDYEATLQAESTVTDRETRLLARQMGTASMRLGIYGSSFQEGETPAYIMTQVVELESKMHHSIQGLGRVIGTNPSVAQLRSESSDLGSHIIRSSLYPVEMKRAFRNSLGEVSDELGY